MEDYKQLTCYTKLGKWHDYIDCMIIACQKVGLTDIKVYSQGETDYQGDMDIHVEAKKGQEEIYYYLRQNYGSCSYCDWLQNVGEERVIEEYIEYLKEALDIFERGKVKNEKNQ
jgi:hypothetical protein